MLTKIYSQKVSVYVSLYFRNSQVPLDSYHWAILVETKLSSLRGGTSSIQQYHVKNTMQPGVSGRPWVFEESPLKDSSTRFRLLTRVLVARVKKSKLRNLSASLRSVPLIQNNPNWTCRIWVKEALAKLDADAILEPEPKSNNLQQRGIRDWDTIETECRRYIAEKRVAGRWLNPGVAANFNFNEVPTYDMLQGRETSS